MNVKEWSKLNNKDTVRGHRLIVRTPFTSSQSLFIPSLSFWRRMGACFFPLQNWWYLLGLGYGGGMARTG